ncbi:MAG: hypothetical protein IKS18_06890 [Lachnospiraceae bacterium]|nr:hypothetical protein [Lachnospiraceae bacterium]
MRKIYKTGLLCVLAALSVLASCFGKKSDYLELIEPDRIYAYRADREQVFRREDREFGEIYEIVKEDWEAARAQDTNRSLPMIQLLWLEQESLPKDQSRIVFEYDKPIRWMISPGNDASGESVNTYIFFLNPEGIPVVLCLDEDYEDHAFFPVVQIRTDQIRRILESAD